MLLGVTKTCCYVLLLLGVITMPSPSENLPACLAKEASLAHLQVEGIYPFGLDVPECDGEGKFRPTQCHGSTGHCWCVNPETGEEIEGRWSRPNISYSGKFRYDLFRNDIF